MLFKQFWYKPRQQRWRGWMFQIHLWAGIIIGLYAILIGLTGSVLVFREEIEAAIEPELIVVEPRDERASLEKVAAEVSALFPNHQILGYRYLNESHRSHR